MEYLGRVAALARSMNSEIGLTIGEYVSPIVERSLTWDSVTKRHLSFKNVPFESFFSLWNIYRLM